MGAYQLKHVVLLLQDTYLQSFEAKDGAFVSATTEIPDISTQNRTKVYPKDHKRRIIQRKDDIWKPCSSILGRGGENTAQELG